MKLVIGNKNHSSWSMRPWVLMRHFGIAFDEVLLRFDFAPGSAFYRELARETIAQWRRDNNEVRPHSSIGRIPPGRFAEQQPTRSRNLQPGLLPKHWYGGKGSVRRTPPSRSFWPVGNGGIRAVFCAQVARGIDGAALGEA